MGGKIRMAHDTKSGQDRAHNFYILSLPRLVPFVVLAPPMGLSAGLSSNGMVCTVFCSVLGGVLLVLLAVL